MAPPKAYKDMTALERLWARWYWVNKNPVTKARQLKRLKNRKLERQNRRKGRI